MLSKVSHFVVPTLYSLPHAFTRLNRFVRYSSSKKGDHRLTYVPHAFPIDEAAKRFTEFDQRRLFAPLRSSSTDLVTSDKSSLTAVFVPVCSVHANINSTRYKGEVGKDSYVTDYHTDSKGNVYSTTRIVTTWYPITGTMGVIEYTPDHPNLSIYFGGAYDCWPIEKAISGYNLQGGLQAFNKETIDKNITIDPWVKVDAYGVDQAIKRIHHEENYRANADIRKHCWDADHTRVHHTSISFAQHPDGRLDFGLKAMMLPIYVLQYSKNPIRVLPAISEQTTQVIGSSPISSIKVSAATTIATTLLSFFFPQVAISTRIGLVIGSAGFSALFANFKPTMNHYSEQRHIKQQQETNEAFARSPIDDARLKATQDKSQQIPSTEPTLELGVEAKHYQVLGFEPNQELTDDEIRSAFRNKILSNHSDKGGNDEQTRAVIEARNILRSACLKHNNTKSTGKRHFSTYRTRDSNNPDWILKEPPRSFSHPNTGFLIKLVLEEKQYNKALALIEQGELHPDGFDAHENTLLTEAVKRKDVKAVEFALTQAKCSVDLSCDCPLHNTAMHYWAEGAGSQNGKNRQAEDKIFNLLIQHKARVNLINTKGNTPLDMTKDQIAVKMLEAAGGIRHTSQEGTAGYLASIRGFFGFTSSQRTLLLQENTPKQLPSSNTPK